MHGLANAKVLVVEEELSIKLLGKFKFGTARDNMEAVRMVEKQGFPIVVVDPGGSGTPGPVETAVDGVQKAITGARAAVKIAREAVENTSLEELDN